MVNNEKLSRLWEGRISDFENIGLTMKKWCEKNHFKVHQLQYWRRKFKTNKDKSLELVQVDLNPNQNEVIYNSIKINIGKLGIEVHDGFNPILLKEVIKVLVESC